MVWVVAEIDYLDCDLKRMKYTTDTPWEVNLVRAKYLKSLGYVKILEEM